MSKIEIKETLLDKAIGYMSPRTAVKRRIAKETMYRYKAASQNYGRNRGVASNSQNPESSTYQRDRNTIIKEVRELAENSGLVQGILNKYAAYGVGNVTYQANTGDKDLNEEIENHFKKWAKRADITGRFSLHQLAQLATIGERRDGDVGLIWIQQDGDAPRLQIIEADRIGNPNSISNSENNAGGILINDNGVPIQYEIYSQDRNSNSYRREGVFSSRDFIHHFIPYRPSQYRGVSCFAPIINKLKDLEEILEAEQIGVKANSMHAAIVFNENGFADVDDLLNADNSPSYSDGESVNEVEHKFGRFWFLKQGDKVQPMLGNRPSPTFNGFLESIIRDVATNLNLPYGVIYNLSGLTGPAARTELALADRQFQYYQGHLQANILDPIRDKIIFFLLANGVIDGDPLNPLYYRGRWQFPAKMSIDAGRDSVAAINEVKAGLRTKASFYIQAGQDPQEAEDQIYIEAKTKLERAKVLSEENGVPMNLALEMLGNPSLYQIQNIDNDSEKLTNE